MIDVHVYQDIAAERLVAALKANNENDPNWSHNDWIAFAIAYLGRAADGVYRNVKEGQDYRANMIKAAGLIVSAVAAYDATTPETVAERATA